MWGWGWVKLLRKGRYVIARPRYNWAVMTRLSSYHGNISVRNELDLSMMKSHFLAALRTPLRTVDRKVEDNVARFLSRGSGLN